MRITFIAFVNNNSHRTKLKEALCVIDCFKNSFKASNPEYGLVYNKPNLINNELALPSIENI